MPRDSNGTYTLPVSAFVAGTVIISGDMNSNLIDIGIAITDSLATTGVSTMTGPVRLADGAVTAPSMTFNSLFGTGFYRAASNVLGIAVSSVDIAQVNVSATVSWGYSHIFNDVVEFASVVSSIIGVHTTVTVTGALTVTGGMNVGFSAAPTVDTLALGDANLLLDFNSGTAPRLQFDTNDFISYTRASNLLAFIINSVTAESISSSAIYYSNGLELSITSGVASASASSAVLFMDEEEGPLRVRYIDDDGNITTMGGPGYWEVVATMTLTTSVASFSVSLDKLYSRLVIVGTSVSPATAAFSNSLLVQASDVDFASSVLFDGVNDGSEKGSNFQNGTTNGSIAILPSGSQWPLGDTASFSAEIMDANQIGYKPLTGYSYSGGSNQQIMSLAGRIDDDEYGRINALRVLFSLSNILTGNFTIYGELVD